MECEIKLLEKNNEAIDFKLEINDLIAKQSESEKTNESLAIAWVNLSVFKKSLFSKKKTVILDNINGQLNFGTLTALIGPSGAGKTTLHSYINGFNQFHLSNESWFFVNKTKFIRSSFIGQNYKQHLIMKLTVKESLMYSSLFKNYQIRNNHLHQDNIAYILDQLLLSDCQDNLIVNCSSEEQMRLSIALELTSIEKPNLMCIDQPTGGIDSNAYEKVNKNFFLNNLSIKINLDDDLSEKFCHSIQYGNYNQH